MAERLIMRFSPKGMKLYDQILEHVKECFTCGRLARGGRDPVFCIHKLGCLTGVLLAAEWMAEYHNLHNAEEKKAHDEFAKEHGVDSIAKAIRARGKLKVRGG